MKVLRDKLKFYKDANLDSVEVKKMWQEFKSCGSQKIDNVPSAVFNVDGKLIVKKKEITKALRKEISNRLRERQTKEAFKYVNKLEKEILNEIIVIVENEKVEEASMDELNVVLRDLKMKKARDHEGISSIIFKICNIGDDLKNSVLILVNKILKTKNYQNVV